MPVSINKIKISLLYFKAAKYRNKAGTVNDFSFAPRPFHSLALILEGKAIFMTNDINVEVGAGDMIFVPWNCVYKSIWPQDSVFITMHFNFEQPNIIHDTQEYLLQKITGFDFDYYKKEFDYIYKNSENKDYDLFSVMSKFYNICFKFFPELTYLEKKRYSKNIVAAISYIEDNFSSDFDVPTLAKKSFLSESRFYDVFKKETGYSPVDYKNFIRIKHAIRLLGNNKKIEEITSELGFNSSTYFRRTFKKITGKSPKEFKKMYYNL